MFLQCPEFILGYILEFKLSLEDLVAKFIAGLAQVF